MAIDVKLRACRREVNDVVQETCRTAIQFGSTYGLELQKRNEQCRALPGQLTAKPVLGSEISTCHTEASKVLNLYDNRFALVQ